MSADTLEPVDRRNNYDVLRLIAAMLVLYSHAFALTGHPEPAVPFTNDTLGFDAVLIFFSLSGMLVTASWRREPRLLPFAWKRALRIIPGLLVCNVLAAYLLGPLLSDLSGRTYLLSQGPLRFVVGNTLMRSVILLPEVFTRNAQMTVNGSIITLPVEVKAYVLLAVVGLIVAAGSWGRRAVLLPVLALAVAGAFLTGLKSPGTLMVLFGVFLGGAVIELLGSRVQVRAAGFTLAVAGWVASYRVPFPLHVVLVAVCVPYLTYYLGHRVLRRLRPATRFGDFSYGIYIYAFPVEQALISWWGIAVPPLRVVAVSLPITYLLGAGSWLLVEKRCLALKNRRPWLLARDRTAADGARF